MITAQPYHTPILLVDDKPENLLSLEALLSDQGYKLVKALSGNEALCMTLKQDFALVLLDVQMPGMDGFETAELMRLNPKTKHIPIIFVTAGTNNLHFQFKGYGAGAVDYLAKPIEPMFLQSKVRIFAELHRQRRELESHKNHLEELVESRMAQLRHSSAELKTSNEELKQSNVELKNTEELLRKQVVECVETHDQLLSTEEMLRMQIVEYETTQKLLNESNTSLQAIFDVSPLAIIISSFPDGAIRKINRTFGDKVGCTDDQVIGKTCIELGFLSDHNEQNKFSELMHEQKSVSEFAAELTTLHGEKRHVLLYSNLMDYNNENCRLVVILDVTEQKKLEDQLRQTQKMDVIGQLAGGIAHDFNNMLTAILGSTELMAKHVTNDPGAEKLLVNIQKAAMRSAELTGQLLAFSRKEKKNLVKLCAETTINDVISLLERTIGKNITLKTRFRARNSCIIGDPAPLQNALLNLGVNARDAMPEGGVITFATANVELNSGYCEASVFNIAPGPYIEISVSDTGTGMTKDIIRRAFEPFFTTKGIGKGTGLGLAAVYGTITDHSGCVTVYSEPGTGTVFKLYFPLSGNKKLPVSECEELVHGSGGILLVDDEEILREVGQTQLENLGYRVYLAENGEQALEVYAREKDNISLVILDMIMPGMGGRETLVRLRESYPDIRVLISSGFSQEETVNELESLGAKGFLQKPYIRQELCKAIAEAINQ